LVPVCAPGEIPGGRAALAVFARHFHRRHARGAGGTCGD
jgi:hypothetical protein